MKKSLGPRTIVYPTPVFVVGTYDREGKPNLMAASWGGICCSQPPCVAISLRKATYSYGNIVESKAFTINIPSEDLLKEADYAGSTSGRDTNKFQDLGLTSVKSELVNAPFVEQFPFILECRLLHTFELGLHTQFVGEILDVKTEESITSEDGIPDLSKLKPIFYDPGTRAYYSTGRFLGKAYSTGLSFPPAPGRQGSKHGRD
jgi:flavin reductase (DIM6/NTAB) family NADH-FMN oxidoreductase RutF